MSVLELNGRVFDASTTGTLTLTSEGGAATTDVTQGLAKSWICATISSNTHTIVDSFNVGSLTDDGVGRTDVVFTNNMAATQHSSVSSCAVGGSNLFTHLGSLAEIITSQYRMQTQSDAGTATDYDIATGTTHGDLA